jgi:hypothetical protein
VTTEANYFEGKFYRHNYFEENVNLQEGHRITGFLGFFHGPAF